MGNVKVLFLDDRSKRIHEMMKRKDIDVRIVTNVTECLYFMARESYEFIFLDHDLGGKEFQDPDDKNCGMEVVRYLEKTAWPPDLKRPIFRIHSSNSFAARLMEIRLQRMGFYANRVPFIYEQS